MLIDLNYPEPVPVELDAAKTLLLIIDMERFTLGNQCGESSPRFGSFGKKYGELAGESSTRNLSASPRRLSSRFSKTRYANWKEAGGRS